MMRAALLLILAAAASGAMLHKAKGRFTPEQEALNKITQEQQEYEDMMEDLVDKMNEQEAKQPSISPLSGLSSLGSGKGLHFRESLDMKESQAMDSTVSAQNKTGDWKKKLGKVIEDVGSLKLKKLKKPKNATETKKRDYKSSNPLNAGYDLPKAIIPLWAFFMQLDPVNPETQSLKSNVIDMICTEFPSTEGCTTANVQSCREIGDCTTGKETYVIIGGELYKVAKGFGVSKKELVSRTATTVEKSKSLKSNIASAVKEALQATAPAEDIAAEAGADSEDIAASRGPLDALVAAWSAKKTAKVEKKIK